MFRCRRICLWSQPSRGCGHRHNAILAWRICCRAHVLNSQDDAPRDCASNEALHIRYSVMGCRALLRRETEIVSFFRLPTPFSTRPEETAWTVRIRMGKGPNLSLHTVWFIHCQLYSCKLGQSHHVYHTVQAQHNFINRFR